MEEHIMQTVITINAVIMALFFVCYSYQFFYVAVALLKRKKFTCRNENHRIAVLIAARNEENVIGQLLDSIHAQKNYPMDHVDIYVGADNCTDDTARVARERGAIVFERHDTVHVGKGYVLNEMLQRIKRPGRKHYDAYLVLDADNILDPNFISEIEKVYSSGYEIVTCYRNSKNYGDNWISAGYALWFLREAQYLMASRGYAVMGMSYRLVPEVTVAGQVQDVFASLHWLAEHGSEYGFDLSRVLLTGDSAGGHLTGLVACVQLNPDLQALYQVEPLPFAFTALAIAHGVCDVYRFRLFTPLLDRALTREYLHLMLGRPWRHSPLRGHVSFEDTAPGLPLPPILVIASQPDRYYAQSKRLIRYLDNSPFPHQVIYWSRQQSERATHVFEVGWWDWPESRDTNDRTLAFFDQVCRGDFP